MNSQGQSRVDAEDAGKAEALKTFIEQTKLLVSLASDSFGAARRLYHSFRKSDGNALSLVPWRRFFWAESLLVGSILAGYVVLGTIAGSQHRGEYNVHRPATRVSSIVQLLLYLAGIVVFLFMTKAIL